MTGTRESLFKRTPYRGIGEFLPLQGDRHQMRSPDGGLRPACYYIPKCGAAIERRANITASFYPTRRNKKVNGGEGRRGAARRRGSSEDGMGYSELDSFIRAT